MDKKKLRDIVQFPTRRGNFEDARQSTFQMCYTHELCGFNSDLIGHYIPLLFKSKRLHEIFIVRYVSLVIFEYHIVVIFSVIF